MAHDWTLIGFY